MFERKTASTSTTTSNPSSNPTSYTTTATATPSLSINSNHNNEHLADHHNHNSNQQQQNTTSSTNSPSNLSILRDYKQQHHANNSNNTPPQSPPVSPRQNNNVTNNNNNSNNKRLSTKLLSNSTKRLSVNLLLSKLGGNANDHHYSSSSAALHHQLGGGSGSNNNSTIISNLLIDSTTLNSSSSTTINREGSQILLGVPYREGLGYRKTSHWPYRYNKRYFVLKNHHLRIYRSIADYQQHQQYSAIVKHALKQQQQQSDNNSNNNGNSVIASNNIINHHDLYDNYGSATSVTSFTGSNNNNNTINSVNTPPNMITTPFGDIIPKVDTSSFMLYKIPLRHCKIFKFHTTTTNEPSNPLMDYRSSIISLDGDDHHHHTTAAASTITTAAVTSSVTATSSPRKNNNNNNNEEKKAAAAVQEEDDGEDFELHFLPPYGYTGPGVTGQKAYKLQGDEETASSSSPSSVLYAGNGNGDNNGELGGSGASSAIFKLKFKGSNNEWFKLLDKAIFLAGKTGDNEGEEDVWNPEPKKEFDEEEWLSQYKKEQQQDMMDLPVFLRPLQMQIQQHNDELLIDQQEKQKQMSAEKNMSLKKRLSQYFSSGSSGGNNSNTNKRNSSNSYAVSEIKPFDVKSDNLVDSISSLSTASLGNSSGTGTTNNNNSEKRRSGYVVDDSIPDITDMSQLQDLIKQHDDDDNITLQLPSSNQPKFASDKTTGIIRNEEKKGSALHRLSTNLSELFSKNKKPSPTTNDMSDTISVDGQKKEKRKSVFGRLLNINKEK